jgi:hypothetical protein
MLKEEDITQYHAHVTDVMQHFYPFYSEIRSKPSIVIAIAFQ